ncbi:hypothetical protein GCM10023084_30260 [Streptomyces lacrimifluminis]|uniref:DUF4192 domain-containing protein n=1 Tax=Streptomyces lacrimifluminis TaxID=1500077 RepID=A0A917NUB2_9ACTN|nr:DUF4192 domain-containing protein [Streptomyces lacrimifluminis]GGJ28882.1 hypothetical protein GCM10012282_26880 [Streptomyces lacrimifluminis]
MTNHSETHQVTLRTPAELADALPYLLGYHPEDSIVLVALHDRDGRGRFGGRARLGIPANPDDWPAVAQQLTHGLVTGSERRGARPESMVVYLCQEPTEGEAPHQVRERLRPLAQLLRTECGRLDVPVVEALCIADNRFWSYCCVTPECCPDDGVPMGLPGTSVLAAAATYAGLQVRGTLSELRARFHPWETAAALEQERALDIANARMVPRILDDASRADVAEETLRQASQVRSRFAGAPTVAGTFLADLRDDELLAHDEAATLILGLQDRTTRDRAAEWMEGDEAAPALRLWRALARRCVGPYREHAAAPLTLAGWVAWSTGDELEAREALAMALGADPGYLFARLLHQACNEGLDPESIRRCLRAERGGRPGVSAGPPGSTPDTERTGVGDTYEDRDIGWGEDPQGFEATEGSEGTERFPGASGADGVEGIESDGWIDGTEATAPLGDVTGPSSRSTSTSGATRALESATRRRRRAVPAADAETRPRARRTGATRPQPSGRPVVRRHSPGEGKAAPRGHRMKRDGA